MEKVLSLRVFGIPVFTLTESVQGPDSEEEDDPEPFGFHGGSGGSQEARWTEDVSMIDAG